MNDRILYLKKHAAPASFQQAMRALAAAGFEVSLAPAQNRDGYSARLKKEEEIWLEWIDTDALIVAAVLAPNAGLKSEVSSILDSIHIDEVKTI